MIAYMAKEVGLIALVMILGYWKGLDGIREAMYSGFGQTLVTFSVLWFIASFFRMNLIRPWIISLLCALALFIFGFGLDKYGLGSAIMLISGCSLIITIVCYQMNPDKGIIWLSAGCALLVAGGLITGSCDIGPTHREYVPVDDSVYLWNIWMEYQPVGGDMFLKDDVTWPEKKYFKGTRTEAETYYKNKKRLFMEKNPDIKIIEEHVGIYHTGRI